MLFNIDGDSGSRIEGWIMPDNPSVTPGVLVVIAGKAVANIKAHILRPLLREQGLHDTGVCGFVVDTKECPDLIGAADVQLFDTDTNVRIYRRRPEEADIDVKLFRLEGQLLRNTSLNEALEPHFHMVFTRLEMVPEETVKSMIGIPFSPSIYSTGRVYYRVFEPLLRDRGFKTCVYLRDPLEELAEQLLLLQWAGTRPPSAFKGILHDSFLGLVDLIDSETLKTSGQIETWLMRLSPRARATLTDPMTRLLTCLSSDERAGSHAVADALDTLAECLATGFDSDMPSFAAHMEAALDIDLPVFPARDPAKRVLDLAGRLSKMEIVGEMLALDRELYDTATAAFEAAR